MKHGNIEHQHMEYQNVRTQKRQHQNTRTLEHRTLEHRTQNTRTIEQGTSKHKTWDIRTYIIRKWNTRTWNTRTLECQNIEHQHIEHRTLEHAGAQGENIYGVLIKLKKLTCKEAVKQELSFLVYVKTRHIYFSSNIKFETFHFHECSSENILKTCAFMVTLDFTVNINDCQRRNSLCGHGCS